PSRPPRLLAGDLAAVQVPVGRLEAVPDQWADQYPLAGEDDDAGPHVPAPRMRSIPMNDSGTIAPTMNCAQNSANSIQASRTLIESVTSTATAKKDCAAVRNNSSPWCASTGRPCSPPAAIANTIGRVPTSRGPWFPFEDR